MLTHQISKSIEPPNLWNCDRQDILTYFQRAWECEECLMRCIIDPDVFYVNPDPLRNLLIFYLGHSAVFYINKLLRVNLIEQRINPKFEILFEIGVDPERPDDIVGIFNDLRQVNVDAVWAYRDQVYQRICQLISSFESLDLPITPRHPLWALMMAIEHQYIHIETSSMLLRQLPIEQLQCPSCWQYAVNYHNLSPSPVSQSMVKINGGLVHLGKPKDDYTYGWDIEYGDRLVQVPTFWASKYLITNHDFLEFVRAGGYENQDYWSDAAWQWKIKHGVHHPKFWIPQESHKDPSQPMTYHYRSLFAQVEMPWYFPVEVNYYEAIAYCQWKGNLRLMSEAEWNLAAYGSITDTRQTDTSQYNFNLRYGSPHEVGSCGADESGLADLRGNVWEWLGDHLTPLAGYQPHPLYANYSAPYFDECHYMMVGGSWITGGTQAGRYYRNWFRPHFYQHSGFRVVATSPQAE
jgi:5-histidylcysteine sulfoxide synthase